MTEPKDGEWWRIQWLGTETCAEYCVAPPELARGGPHWRCDGQVAERCND